MKLLFLILAISLQLKAQENYSFAVLTPLDNSHMESCITRVDRMANRLSIILGVEVKGDCILQPVDELEGRKIVLTFSSSSPKLKVAQRYYHYFPGVPVLVTEKVLEFIFEGTALKPVKMDTLTVKNIGLTAERCEEEVDYRFNEPNSSFEESLGITGYVVGAFCEPNLENPEFYVMSVRSIKFVP